MLCSYLWYSAIGKREIKVNKIKILCNKHQELILYLIVGVLTTVVSLGVYYGCVLTVLNPQVAWELQIANILSWIVAVTFAYFASRQIVFKSVRKDWLNEAVAFYMARVVTLLMDMALMFVLVTIFHWNDKIVKLIVQVVVTVANYVLSKMLVFREKKC